MSYTSRWKPKAGGIHALTERDLAIFKLLTRYACLPVSYIQALLGGESTALRDRLKCLVGDGYLDRPEGQKKHYQALYRPLVYSLGKRGADALHNRGIEGVRPPVNRNFAHELMTCELMASLELGARETGTRLITWPDILESEALPDKTRRLDAPLNIPFQWTADSGKREVKHIRADGQPFGIERVRDGRTGYFFCPGVEADCATEPVDTNDLNRSSIVRKFREYHAVFEQDVYRSHFGFPNFFVPIITTNTVRMRSMMEALKRISGGKGSKMFLFKTHPAFTSFEPPRPPSGHMLTEPWTRVGNPDFSFVT